MHRAQHVHVVLELLHLQRIELALLHLQVVRVLPLKLLLTPHGLALGPPGRGVERSKSAFPSHGDQLQLERST
jgi:hypothetical protein